MSLLNRILMEGLDGSLSRLALSGAVRGFAAPLRVHTPDLPKPPNIVVYTGEDKECFEKVEKAFLGIVPVNRFTVFHISSESLRGHPWFERNTSCLLVAKGMDSIDSEMCGKIQDYLNQAGNVGFFSSSSVESIVKSVLKPATAESVLTALKSQEKNASARISHKSDLVTAVEVGKSKIVVARNSAECEASVREMLVHLGVYHAVGRSEGLPDLTQGYMVFEKDLMVLSLEGLTYSEPIGRAPKLLFKPSAAISPGSLPIPCHDIVPVEIRRRKNGLPAFDVELFFSKLKTKEIGKAVLSFPVCESTMDISRSIVAGLNKGSILVIAQQQTKGRGRGGNMWLSPAGCIMYTFNYAIPLDSKLGQNSAFVQHLLAVAMVDAVFGKLNSTFKEFPFGIKWPNDLYFDRKYKMGGILVTASFEKDVLHCVLGAALNVANSQPTVCLNDFITPEMGPKLNIEETLAEIMNKFEMYVDMFQTEGNEGFLRAYHRFWLHSGEIVDIQEKGCSTTKKAKILGLDSQGYLEVKSQDDGRPFTVVDDGNTFDMMKGLIRPKNT